MYNMIQKSDRDNHDYFVTLENSMNNMIPIGSRIIDGFIGRNMEKSCIILIFILKTPIRQFIRLVL